MSTFQALKESPQDLYIYIQLYNNNKIKHKSMIHHYHLHEMQTDEIDNELNISEMIINKQPYYGYLKPLFKDADGKPKYMLGPHYPIFLTSFLFCFLMVVIFFLYQIHLYSAFWKVILVLSSGSFLLSYLNIGFSKPGIAMFSRPLSKTERSSNKYCNICEVIRDRKTQHCDDCGVCILQYDHHCPWVGKCIGQQNLTAFYLFIALTFGNLIIYFIASIVTNLMQKVPNAAIPA